MLARSVKSQLYPSLLRGPGHTLCPPRAAVGSSIEYDHVTEPSQGYDEEDAGVDAHKAPGTVAGTRQPHPRRSAGTRVLKAPAGGLLFQVTLLLKELLRGSGTTSSQAPRDHGPGLHVVPAPGPLTLGKHVADPCPAGGHPCPQQEGPALWAGGHPANREKIRRLHHSLLPAIQQLWYLQPTIEPL